MPAGLALVQIEVIVNNALFVGVIMLMGYVCFIPGWSQLPVGFASEERTSGGFFILVF